MEKYCQSFSFLVASQFESVSKMMYDHHQSVETPLPPQSYLVSAQGGGPSYLNAEALSSYPNLRLLSNDGVYFQMNRCVLAAVSPMLGKTPQQRHHNSPDQLSEEALDHDLSITTDLSRNELQMVVK